MKKILLAIPCYNCATQLKRLLDELKMDPVLKIINQILIIDNCSMDETYSMALNMAGIFPKEKIIVMKNPINLGLGGSFKKIVNFSYENKFEYFFLLHGDNQASVSDLKFFLNLVENTSYDAYLGARFMPNSVLINYSRARKMANLFLNQLFSFFLPTKIFDLGSGLNLYRTSVFPISFVENLPTHLAFDLPLLLYFLEYKKKFEFIPITWKQEDEESNARNIPLFIQLISIFFHWRIKSYLRFLLRSQDLDKSRIFFHK